jgi:hypothetical protein
MCSGRQNGPVCRRLVTRLAVGAIFSVCVACSSASSRSTSATTVPQPQISVPSHLRGIGHTFNARDWQYLWTKEPGTSKHQCVAVRPRWTGARSGSFSAGNFAAYIGGWDGTVNNTKLAYIPRYPDQNQPLTLSVMPLDGQAQGQHTDLGRDHRGRGRARRRSPGRRGAHPRPPGRHALRDHQWAAGLRHRSR